MNERFLIELSVALILLGALVMAVPWLGTPVAAAAIPVAWAGYRGATARRVSRSTSSARMA